MRVSTTMQIARLGWPGAAAPQQAVNQLVNVMTMSVQYMALAKTPERVGHRRVGQRVEINLVEVTIHEAVVDRLVGRHLPKQTNLDRPVIEQIAVRCLGRVKGFRDGADVRSSRESKY